MTFLRNLTFASVFLAFVFFTACDNSMDKDEPKPAEPKNNDLLGIKKGTFNMTRTGKIGKAPNPATFEVTLDAFSIGKNKVTQGEWKELMGKNPVKVYADTTVFLNSQQERDNYKTNFVGDKKPVIWVSWYDVLEYLNKLSDKDKLTKVYTLNKNSSDNQGDWSATANYSNNGYRLPTEAEWEYAVIGGKALSTYNNLDEFRWSEITGLKDVGGKKATGFGLFDALGQPWEFVWGDNRVYSNANYPTSAQVNYRTNPNGHNVFGRSSYGSSPIECAGHYAPSPSATWGFRIAKNG